MALAQAITAVPQVAEHKHAFIPELDGVRGVAILLVMVYHSFVILPTPPILISLWLTLPIGLGWSGVDLFFVLSGFLITGILLESKESRNYFSSFYARRILRIFPLYFLAIFLYFDLALPIAHHLGQLIYLTKTLEPWFWFHLSNWKVAFINPAGWLEHFWSLSIEEQFYMFWPLVVFWTPRRRIPYLCLLLIAASFTLRCLYAHSIYGFRMVYMLTPFRIEPLVFGSLAAILVRKPAVASRLRNRRLLSIAAGLGVLLLMGAVVAGGSPIEGVPMATLGLTALAVIYTCLVLYAYLYSNSTGWLASVLRNPFLRSFGKYSYALYVFHVLLYRFCGVIAKSLSPSNLGKYPFTLWILGLGTGIVLSYGAALISWNFVEKHFWRLKSRFSPVYAE